MKNDFNKHIYLVRHGMSRANETGIREGEDSPLTEEGEKQADYLADRFRGIPVDLVLSSHYKRAHDTGVKVAEACNAPFEVVSMAHERELPIEVHGKHREDPAVREMVKKFEEDWINGVASAEGESFSDIKKRVMELIKLIEERPEKHIVVTSHGFFLKFFVAYQLLGEYLTPEIFIKKMMYSMRSANTGITYFTVSDENDWTLAAWNDYAHLGELIRERWYS